MWSSYFSPRPSRLCLPPPPSGASAKIPHPHLAIHPSVCTSSPPPPHPLLVPRAAPGSDNSLSVLGNNKGPCIRALWSEEQLLPPPHIRIHNCRKWRRGWREGRLGEKRVGPGCKRAPWAPPPHSLRKTIILFCLFSIYCISRSSESQQIKTQNVCVRCRFLFFQG